MENKSIFWKVVVLMNLVFGLLACGGDPTIRPACQGDQCSTLEDGDEEMEVEKEVVEAEVPVSCIMFLAFSKVRLDTPLPIHVGDQVKFHLDPDSSWSASEGCHVLGWMVQMIGMEPEGAVEGVELEYSSVDEMADAPKVASGVFTPRVSGQIAVRFVGAWVQSVNNTTVLQYGSETSISLPVRAAKP